MFDEQAGLDQSQINKFNLPPFSLILINSLKPPTSMVPLAITKITPENITNT